MDISFSFLKRYIIYFNLNGVSIENLNRKELMKYNLDVYSFDEYNFNYFDENILTDEFKKSIVLGNIRLLPLLQFIKTGIDSLKIKQN